jgi:hypothetical protein
MGDRYIFFKKCPNCGNEIECYYAPSSDMTDERCNECGKEYDIVINFELIPKKEIKHGYQSTLS